MAIDTLTSHHHSLVATRCHEAHEWAVPVRRHGRDDGVHGRDCPPSPSSPAFRAVGGAGVNEETDSGSSSSCAADALSFSFSTSGQRSPSTSTSSALCFGAGGGGTRLWSSSKALARTSKIHGEEYNAQAAATVALAPKGYAVGRHLRRISRRLRKARAANKETPATPLRRGAAVDDTARERAEAVASAIAHCKETLRRGTPQRRRPLPSLSHDLWLRDRQDEIIASAAAHCDDECGGSRPPAAVFPTALARHAPCMRLPPISGRESAAAATGTPPPSSQISGPVASSREAETRGGFCELEFLETFDGDEELIDRHFITVEI